MIGHIAYLVHLAIRGGIYYQEEDLSVTVFWIFYIPLILISLICNICIFCWEMIIKKISNFIAKIIIFIIMTINGLFANIFCKHSNKGCDE